MKANSNQAVLKTLGRLGAGIDVVSEGELRRALAADIPASRIMAASSQSGSGKKFWLLGGGVLLVIALYTGGWFYAASALKNTVLKAIAPRDQAGVSGECSDIEFRGYPFRIGLFCSKIDVDDNVNGVSATFGALRSAAQVYAPGNIVWELDSPAEIRTSNGLSISAQWTNLQASLTTRLQGIDHSSTVIEGLKAMAFSSYTGQTMTRKRRLRYRERSTPHGRGA